MFPKASVIRFEFAPYGNMPALKVFWYDGLKEDPKIAGVPEGEWIGDPPSVQRAGDRVPDVARQPPSARRARRAAARGRQAQRASVPDSSPRFADL